jgi:hypothetical protein
MDFDDASARQFLELPPAYAVPDVDDIAHDARAILLHTVNLRRDTADSGVQISPIWENREGQASLRATIVPKEVEKRHFEGPGIAALRDPSALTMVCDVVELLAAEPLAAAKGLGTTAQLWISEEAPIRSLGVPFKGHFKLLTLTIADFFRKVGAGFTELEWFTSLGLLEAFHDPAQDPPADEIRASTREKTAKMCADEEAWMAALVAKG